MKSLRKIATVQKPTTIGSLHLKRITQHNLEMSGDDTVMNPGP